MKLCSFYLYSLQVHIFIHPRDGFDELKISAWTTRDIFSSLNTLWREKKYLSVVFKENNTTLLHQLQNTMPLIDTHDNSPHVELPVNDPDPLIRFCHIAIRIAIKALSILMVLVIFFGIGDVIYLLYQRLMTPPVYLLNIRDIFESFAAFLAVLVAIEIFVNIRMYLSSEVAPLKLVLATSLMAVARKVIVLDFGKLSGSDILALAAVIFALGMTYGWLFHHTKNKDEIEDH
jgi:uncharacterized membrane protein (DUF373 family)